MIMWWKKNKLKCRKVKDLECGWHLDFGLFKIMQQIMDHSHNWTNVHFGATEIYLKEEKDPLLEKKDMFLFGGSIGKCQFGFKSLEIKETER